MRNPHVQACECHFVSIQLNDILSYPVAWLCWGILLFLFLLLPVCVIETLYEWLNQCHLFSKLVSKGIFIVFLLRFFFFLQVTLWLQGPSMGWLWDNRMKGFLCILLRCIFVFIVWFYGNCRNLIFFFSCIYQWLCVTFV